MSQVIIENSTMCNRCKHKGSTICRPCVFKGTGGTEVHFEKIGNIKVYLATGINGGVMSSNLSLEKLKRAVEVAYRRPNQNGRAGVAYLYEVTLENPIEAIVREEVLSVKKGEK